ncbi:hypothetical protein ACPA54_12935 [Uniformispora flossi]|uniref:hypothetical protein n=1 Tax=Uniformispora flossi TaxID=3390723 RepID=UPI003C2CD92C
MTVELLEPDKLIGRPCRERGVELGFPKAAMETPGGGYNVRPLFLRMTPLEAAVLALGIQEAIGPSLMEEARRLLEHGPIGDDTGVLLRLKACLAKMDVSPDRREASAVPPEVPVTPTPGSQWSHVKVHRAGWMGDAA